MVYALQAVDMLFRKGYNNQKAGVMILDITHKEKVQSTLWEVEDKAKNKKLMAALDDVNSFMGDNTVRFAAQDYSNQRILRAEYLSKCYTTRIEHVITVKD